MRFKDCLLTPEDADVLVSLGTVYTYTEEVFAPVEVAELPNTYALKADTYTVTITKDGYYASEFSFCVTDEGKVTAINNKGNVCDYLKDGVFTIALTEFVPTDVEGAWDGKILDVSWYDEQAKTMTVYTPAQFAGLAAIVNGIYNAEITSILDDADLDGLPESYTPEHYARMENRKIRPAQNVSSTGANNLVTTNNYWFGIKSDDTTPSDFNGQTVMLACDLDMGGWQKEDNTWTGARYMTIGGQSLMHYIDYGAWKSDGLSHLGSSFNGTLDGQGHYVKNVFCDRYGAGTNYGDSSSVGLIGRLGCHDNDPVTLLAVDPTVKNIAVTGYVYGRRSVGAIVGKIGRTTAGRFSDGSTGGIIENCMNFAQVQNTDAKGCGGIVWAGWNNGIVRYCANFGNIHSSYSCPTGGISGSNEVKLLSCYNVGTISAHAPSYVMAIGTNNGGASTVERCFWLTGTATGGGYYNGKGDTEITDNYAGIVSYCYNDGFIDSNAGYWTGGLIGFQNAESSCINSYNAGTLKVSASAAGTKWSWINPIVGQNEGTSSDCLFLNIDTGDNTANYLGSDTTGSGCGNANGGSSSNNLGVDAATLKSAVAITALNAGDVEAFKASCNSYPVLSWQTAVEHVLSYTNDNNGTTHTISCANCDYAVTENYSFFNGVCVCGAYAQPEIKSAYLTLNENIDVTYTVNVPDDLTDLYMVFTMNGASRTVTDYTQADGICYFTFTGVTPQCMGNTISAVFHAKRGTEEVTDTIASYSVKQYCVNQLSANADNTKLVTLLSDLLTYGAAAQSYTGYKTDALVTSDLDLSASTFAAFSGKRISFEGTKSDAADWTAATLVLKNELAIRLIFTAESPTGLTVSVSVNGRTQSFTADDFTAMGDGKYYVEFSGIKATEFDEALTASFAIDGTATGRTVSYSVNTYICGMQNVSNANLQALVRALYNYGASSAAYVAE